VNPAGNEHLTKGVTGLEKREQNLSLNLVINGSLALESIQGSLNSLGAVGMGARLALSLVGQGNLCNNLSILSCPDKCLRSCGKVNREM